MRALDPSTSVQSQISESTDAASRGASKWMDLARERGVDIGLKILGALAIWIVGRWLVALATRLVRRALEARHVDPTIQRYVAGVVETLLNIGLVLALLGFFGVETTSFAAFLGAAGVAIGMAWSGLLAHFASGALLVVLRPFKVGDFVEAGGVTGTVQEIGMFVTKITTPDNVATLVGNNKVFADTIKNYTANPYRRVELSAQLAHDADVPRAIEVLKAALSKIPNVDPKVEPEVAISSFTLAGPVLCVRPFTHNDHYWQVYFETNALIRSELGREGFSVPEQHFAVETSHAEKKAA